MHTFEKLRDRLMDELDRCSEERTPSLDMIDKLTHSIKSIDTIIAMEESGYSKDDYSRRGYGNSYRNRRRDSMGRYSSRMYYDDAKDDLVRQLEDIKMHSDPGMKSMIDDFIMQVRQ